MIIRIGVATEIIGHETINPATKSPPRAHLGASNTKARARTRFQQIGASRLGLVVAKTTETEPKTKPQSYVTVGA